MTEYLLLFLGTALVNNVVLVQFLGLCPFMGTSGKLETAVAMGLATSFILTMASVAGWILEELVLAPLGLEYFRILTIILVIAALVQITELVLQRVSPVIHQLLGIFLPLITSNCAVLGVALLNLQQGHTFLESALYGFGSGVGFTLVLVIFASIRERLALSQVPAAFAGSPIGFIVAGLLSLIFMGFSGMGASG